MEDLIFKITEAHDFINELALTLINSFLELSERYPQYTIPITSAVAIILILVFVLALRKRLMAKRMMRKSASQEPDLDKTVRFEIDRSHIMPEAPEAAASGLNVFETPTEGKPAENQDIFSPFLPPEPSFGAPDEEMEGLPEIEDRVVEMFEKDVAETVTQQPRIEAPPEQKIPQEPDTPGEPDTKEGFFARLRSGLTKTQSGFLGKLDNILSLKSEIDDELWDEFEETLVMADLGVGTTMKLREKIEKELTKSGKKEPKEIKTTLKKELLNILSSAETAPLELNKKPFVIMVAGVNGVGKTTTIGKLAYKFVGDGKKVMVAAADTFRAAAVEQLEVWANRVGSDFLRGQSGADPSSVAFDAVKASIARDTDVLIIDTAGRLHTKTNLMEELKKIRRVVGRDLEGAPHETLLVLDATTGQNAVQQAKTFNEAIEITGLVLTKLDGTAKGGVIVSIADELSIPVRFIGIGESLSDLRRFEAEEFVEALFLTGDEVVH